MIKQVLDDRKILICRPEPSASELARVLESVGATCKVFPTIHIRFIEPITEEKQRVLNLDQYNKVIVVSQFAAQAITEQLDTYWPQAPSPQMWFGIGRKTTHVLADYGLSVHEADRDLRSEDLLESEALKAIKGERILIVKGQGGRSKLEQGLRDRGAKIDTLALYERTLPDYSEVEIKEALVDFKADSVITLSNDTLENLAKLSNQVNLPNETQQCALIVPSKRVESYARSLGYKHIKISSQLKPINLIQSLAR